MRRAFAYLALLLAAHAAGSRSDYISIKQKFSAIEKRQFKPGTRVPLPAREINAYVEAELPRVAPPGVTNARVELLGDEKATGRARIDFLRLRSAQGKASNWFLRKLLEGERDVAVTAQVQSGGGQATVHVRRVEISGVPVEGATLDFLIRNYVLPNYPQAKIGRPFALKHGVDRLDVRPGEAGVFIAARK